MQRSVAWFFLLTAPFLVAPMACGSNADTSSSPQNGDGGSSGSGSSSGGGSSSSSSGSGSGGTSSSSSGGEPSDGGMVNPVTPIKHVVVIVKENHTFDNYFGTFPGAEGTTSCLTTMGQIPTPHAPNSTSRDLCHEHSCALQDWDGAKMDGWLAVSGASMNNDNLFCAQYQQADLPNYWSYAKNFALGDHFFADVLGPSFPKSRSTPISRIPA